MHQEMLQQQLLLIPAWVSVTVLCMCKLLVKVHLYFIFIYLFFWDVVKRKDEEAQCCPHSVISDGSVAV